MKIALVFAPYSHKKFEENIYVVDEDFGIFPPINLAYAAAIAERAGHEARLFDANALLRLGKTSRAALFEEIVAFGPDLLGLYFSTYMFRDTLAWARELKARTGCRVLAGGINTLIYPRETLAHRELDFAVIGHAHESLPRLLEALENQGELSKIPGIAYRVEEETVVNQPRTSAPSTPDVDFDSFPLPARHLLPNELYYSFISQRKNFTISVTTLGCPHGCSFCAIAPLQQGQRSVDNVMDEIDEVYHRYHVREIDYFDASLITPSPRTEELLERMASTPLDLEFSCRARVDDIDRGVARALRRAGFRQVYLGIESAESDILQGLRKPLEATRTREVVELLRREGIRALGFFMIGSPGETMVTAMRTVLFAMKLQLDYAQFSRTIAKPNTGLYAEFARMTNQDYWRDYVLGTAPERRLESPWTGLTETQIEGLTKLGYVMFYYRPAIILKALRRARSGKELERLARTAVRMLLRAACFD